MNIILITNCISLRSCRTVPNIAFHDNELFTAVEDSSQQWKTLRYLAFKERGFYGQQMMLINLCSSRQRRENRDLRANRRHDF